MENRVMKRFIREKESVMLYTMAKYELPKEQGYK